MTDAPEFQYRNDYEDWMLRMLNPRRNQKHFRALIRAIAQACQIAEDGAWNSFLSNQLESASGITLVYAGRKVGEEKGDLDEAEFKRIISARLRALKTRGEPDDLIAIYKALTGADLVLYFGGNGAFVLVAHRSSLMRPEYVARVSATMRLAKPVGIHMQLVEALPPSSTFTYDVGPGYGIGRYSRVING